MAVTSKPLNLAKNYRLVHEIVQEQGPGVHLTMADVHELASRRKNGLGFTTVYRALNKLRDLGLLTRDARSVERKKPGRPKARKRFQFSKR